MKITTRFFPVLLLLLWQVPMLAATVTIKADKLSRHSQALSHAVASPMRPLQATPAAASASLAAKALSPTLSVYPNPSRGLITISVASKLPFGDYKLRLSNIIGREVRSVSLLPQVADGGMNLNISDLPAGMYFYSLVQNDKVVSTKRLVLQN